MPERKQFLILFKIITVINIQNYSMKNNKQKYSTVMAWHLWLHWSSVATPARIRVSRQGRQPFYDKAEDRYLVWVQKTHSIGVVQLRWICYCFQSNTNVHHRQCSIFVKGFYMCICYRTLSCMQCISIVLYSVKWPTDRHKPVWN